MNTTTGLEAEDFDTLDNILDDLRERFDETPQWEFCEGFMAALVCSRRAIPVDEWLPMLLGIDPDEAEGGSFADAAQREQFLALWQRRFDDVRLALDTPVEALDDDKAYAPEVMDVRGAIASLPLRSEKKLTTARSLHLPKSGLWDLCLRLKTGPMNGSPPKTKMPPSGTTCRWKPSWP